MPYMPFVGMFFMAIMPAALNVYWCCLAVTNLACFAFVKTDYFKKIMKIPKYYPNT